MSLVDQEHKKKMSIFRQILRFQEAVNGVFVQRIMANDLADNGTLGSSVKPGFVSYIVQVMGGEMKGQFKYLYVSASLNDKWCVYLSDDTEFDLFT